MSGLLQEKIMEFETQKGSCEFTLQVNYVMDNSWMNLSCHAYESLDTLVVVEISQWQFPQL